MNLSAPLRASLLFLALIPALPAQRAHADPKLGIAIEPPKGWTQLPADTDRGQCEAMFAAPRASSAKGGGTHTPTMRVLFFASGGDASGDERDGLPRTTPYRSFDDYLKRGHGGKARVASREAGECGDFEGRRFEATVTDPAGDRRLYGAAIPLDGGELVVEYEVLGDQFDKERKGFERSLDTLEKVEKQADAAQAADAPWAKDPSGWAAMDAAARKQHAEAAANAAAAHPGIGWKTYESEHWTVLSAADAGFTKKAIAAAEAARDWCEANLDGIAGGGPLPAVLRIFASRDHFAAFTLRQVDPQIAYSPETRELYFFDDPNAGSSDGYGPLFRAVVLHWADDHAPGSVQALPRWLDQGLTEYFRSTRLKGKKIEFAPGEVENGRIAWYRQNDSQPPAIWLLIQESGQPSPEGGANEESWGYTPECARLMRWFFEHDGGEAFGKPNLVQDYLVGLAEAYRTIGPNPTADVDAARLDEARTKTMNERFYAWRDSILKACNDKVLPLQPDAWKEVEAKWQAFLADYK